MRSSIINDENAISQQLKQKYISSSSSTKTIASNPKLNSNEIASSSTTASTIIPNKNLNNTIAQVKTTNQNGLVPIPSTASTTRDIISKYKREVLKEINVNEINIKQSQQQPQQSYHSTNYDKHQHILKPSHTQQNESKNQSQYRQDVSHNQIDEYNSYKKQRISSSDEHFEHLPSKSHQHTSSIPYHDDNLINSIYESKFKEEEDIENQEPEYETRLHLESDKEDDLQQQEEDDVVEGNGEEVRRQILLQQQYQLHKRNQLLNHQRQQVEQPIQNNHTNQLQQQQTKRISNPTGVITKYRRSIMIPPWTESIQRELDIINSEPSFKNWDINGEDWDDPTMVCEYSEDIFKYLNYLEIKYMPDPFYIEKVQDDLNWNMRSVLVDWIVQIHNKFNLLPETLFLAINIIDRFLTKRKVSLTKLQLVGAVAILIASKYEEINIPTISEVIHMTDNSFSVEEFTKAECFMIDVLQFDLGWPGPMSFLRRISKADDYDYETRTLAKYFLEITIMDSKFIASPTSWLAAGAHYLSRFLLNKGEWTKAHVYFSGYCERQLRSLAEQILENCKNPEKNHKAIFEKYAERRFRKSSLFVQDYLDHVGEREE
ncbi:CLB4 [Candida jiufengensis]|uniref:CLB4 n=1 Tax=Candida jiufengensis TaxID=497108 RepID=UPI0022248734|nr:CLB4 [Candida jiufengensis]KAI5949291.1 CLB4 [Candida jiufengensis]